MCAGRSCFFCTVLRKGTDKMNYAQLEDSWKKRARNMRMIYHSKTVVWSDARCGEEDEGAFGGGSLAREEEG